MGRIVPVSHLCSHSLQSAQTVHWQEDSHSRYALLGMFFSTFYDKQGPASSESEAHSLHGLQILDPKAGFLVNGCITVSATVLVLEESMQFTRDTDSSAAAGEESLR